MGQHSNPDADRDEDDLEELGMPFYQGTGLSVRALTAEELQQFLDAHTDQPAQLLGTEPRRQTPERRRDWHTAQAALERLAVWSRHRNHRDQFYPDRDRSGRLDRTVGRQERDGR